MASSTTVAAAVAEHSDFVDPEDGFADDDLLSPDESAVLMDIPPSVSFLEREDFETEFGGPADDPFGEDFSAIRSLEIVEVIAEGDRVARPIVVIYAYRLPSSKSIDQAKLLAYLQHTLDAVVDLDYTIVYFHYGLRSHNKPPVKWLFQAYKVLDRKYKKNLKALYVVHPTRFIRIIWGFFKPFISSKFEDKMHYVNSIRDLETALEVSRLNLPQPIRDHDKQYGYSSGDSRPATPPNPPRPTQQFNVSLEFILSHNPNLDIPPLASELIDFLEVHALEVEGIFRKSANVGSIKRLQERINMGEQIDFLNDPEYKENSYIACIHASVLLKTFLRSLGEPVTTNVLYPKLADLSGIPVFLPSPESGFSDVPKTQKTAAVREFVHLLPRPNYLLLKAVIKFLTKVAANSKVNLMTANNLSVVFGPNLTWPTNQQVPMTQLNNLNNFCYRLIVDYETIFD